MADTTQAPKGEVVRMADGRQVTFSNPKKEGQKGQQYRKEFLIGNTPWEDMTAEQRAGAHIKDAAVRLDFRNGVTRKYPLNPALALQYAGHGGLQKYGDELIGETDPAKAVAAADRLHERLMAGEWTKPRAAGEGKPSVLVQALAAYSGVSVADVAKQLAGWKATDKRSLWNDPDIRPFIDKVEKEQPPKKTRTDTSALKASLKGLAA
jgi:hypothetical protein